MESTLFTALSSNQEATLSGGHPDKKPPKTYDFGHSVNIASGGTATGGAVGGKNNTGAIGAPTGIVVLPW